MDLNDIYLTLALCMNIYIAKSEFVDIVLKIGDSNNFNYTRFINVTQQQFVWLSSVLCDINTYSYSITYDRDGGSLVSNSSTTFMAQEVDPTVYEKEFTCTSTVTVFQCTRRQNIQKCDDNKISWMYLSTDTLSTCPDNCGFMCPVYPVQSIIFTYDKQTFKITTNAKCNNTLSHITSTLKSSESSASNQGTSSTIISEYHTEYYNSNALCNADEGVPVYVVIILVIVIVLLLITVALMVFKNKLKCREKWNHYQHDSKTNDSDRGRMSSITINDENSAGYSQYQQVSDVVPETANGSSQSKTLYVNDTSDAQLSNNANNNGSVFYENSIDHLKAMKSSSGNTNNYDSLNLHQKIENVYLKPTL
ncbi:unnamed protein product [Lymnaea stagnalis]|uniref:ShKT domain-containing protein n=1 Tax=Lymnaea stagnalis TaxID=6523 RepID=A0AAV2H7U3_LYMST